ncbi:hypothetical protein NE237_008060 [Protea cynaroides]|uniref:Uncharacterized protein n=1 Tax=Protea cynaroides TaxID=273540 RepID=A0A9Q0KRE1_9MAGN|nr:hypothetical protein NE237_008060 [Protea cynaroides]
MPSDASRQGDGQRHRRIVVDSAAVITSLFFVTGDKTKALRLVTGRITALIFVSSAAFCSGIKYFYCRRDSSQAGLKTLRSLAIPSTFSLFYPLMYNGRRNLGLRDNGVCLQALLEE